MIYAIMTASCMIDDANMLISLCVSICSCMGVCVCCTCMFKCVNIYFSSRNFHLKDKTRLDTKKTSVL